MSVIKSICSKPTVSAKPSSAPISKRPATIYDESAESMPLTSSYEKPLTAIVYCEGNFAALDGKTANGLVRHSEKYKILSVIDSDKSGLDSGLVLDEKINHIPICRDLTDALACATSYHVYHSFKFGNLPIIQKAIETGMFGHVRAFAMFVPKRF